MFIVNHEKWIEWKDGAAILIKRLTKKEAEEHSKNVDSENEKEGVLGVLPAEIEDAQKRKRVENMRTNLFFDRLYVAIRGWRGIVDSEFKELPYCDETKGFIFEQLCQDVDMMGNIIAWMNEPLGNLKAGLSTPSNTNGGQVSAINVSEKAL